MLFRSYPIRVQNADEAINYWIAANQSARRPTWPPIAQKEYVVPWVSNDTVLPTHVQNELEKLEKEYQEGDLTEKGHARKKAKILYDFLDAVTTEATPLHVAMLSSPFPKSNDEPTAPAKLHVMHMVSSLIAEMHVPVIRCELILANLTKCPVQPL